MCARAPPGAGCRRRPARRHAAPRRTAVLARRPPVVAVSWVRPHSRGRPPTGQHDRERPDQYPRRSSAWARRCQSRSTFTDVSRNTGAPSSASSSWRARVPASLMTRAALADHHALLRLALDEHLHLVAQHVVVALGLDLLGDDGDRVRQLLARDPQQLLPHQLGDEERLGLVGDHAVRVVLGSFGQARLELADERVDARRRSAPRAARRRRTRRARRWRPPAAPRPRHGRRGRSCSPPGSSGSSTCCTRSATNRSPGPMRAGGLDEQAHHVDLGERRPGPVVGALAEQRARACGCPACRAARAATAGVVRTPRIWVRVVCGRSETIATLVPTMRFTNVDLPTLGRPTRETNPSGTRSRAAPAAASATDSAVLVDRVVVGGTRAA